MDRARLTDIDRAKGLAIVLVVLGHLGDESVVGNDWYAYLHVTLYKFHMAFFVFLNGFIAFYTCPVVDTWKDYGRYVQRRFIRFIPPYCLIALVVFIAKVSLGTCVNLKRPAGSLFDLVNVFVAPYDSCCRYLWYIYVLFFYCLIVPGLQKLSKRSFAGVAILAFAAYFLPRTEYLAQRHVVEYLFVFVLGGYALRYRDRYLDAIDRYACVFIFVFLMFTGLFFWIDVPKLLFGLVAIPALHSFVRLEICEGKRLLRLLGIYVFPIYLLNPLVIGGLHAVIQKWWSLDGMGFRVAAVLLFASGLCAPIVVYELVIKRTPILRSIIRL